MASAKDGFPAVAGLFTDELARLSPGDQPQRERAFAAFAAQLDRLLTARVHAVVRLTSTIVEVLVEAPLAARKFHPGQFYRLQNYETRSPLVGGTRLMMEGLALTGAWTDPEKGLLSLIVLEMGASSRLCATLQPGDPVVVMGPTGAPTEIPTGESVLLAGGGLGNAVLFSIARAMRDAGNRVIYFAGYKKGEDVFKREEIEAGCDQIVWSTDSGAEIAPSRPQDSPLPRQHRSGHEGLRRRLLGTPLVPLSTVDRIIAIGSDRMMSAVKDARRAVLAPYLKKDHVAIGSINSSMQCMMKESARSACRSTSIPSPARRPPPSFSCFNQDQKLDEVDFHNLAVRLKMNSVQEKLANLWLDHITAKAAATTS
jgi:NAD(P)H-flavin reductase